jgi:hypothetical protein
MEQPEPKPAVFNTITSDDWKRMFAAHRADPTNHTWEEIKRRIQKENPMAYQAWLDKKKSCKQNSDVSGPMDTGLS